MKRLTAIFMQSSWRSHLKFLVIFFVLGFLALYFRTYQIHGGPLISFRSSNSFARDVVDRAMKEQILNVIKKNESRLPPLEIERLAVLQVERLKNENHLQYEQAVRNAEAHIREKRNEKPKYLLEADPYHYFHQTERLFETGRIADVKRAGEYLQPLMRAPYGHWEPINLHPYVGLGCYQLLRVFDPHISIIQAVAYVPLFLTLVVLAVFAVLGRILEVPLSASTIGMMTVVLSPIYIQRSAFGWFDTDPYNYIFPMAILSCVLGGLKQNRKLAFWALCAGFFTGAYALFWTGWSFMLLLMPACILMGAGGAWFFERGRAIEVVTASLRFLGVYLGASGLFLALFLTPMGFLNCMRLGWDVLNQFALAKWDIWPNVFLTVGEANGIGFKKLIFLTGNYFTFGLAIVGFFLEGWSTFRKGNHEGKFRWFFLVTFSVPILLMSLKTERFSLLFVLPLAVFASLAVMRLLQMAVTFPKISGLPAFFEKDYFRKSAVLLSVFLGFLPMNFLSAHVVAGGIQPIMDDVWHSALLELRQKTPENAIINSWWPPGYFVTAVARRAVVGDGGTQHFHATYWISRALMAEDEREAAGIFRMLNLSGNDALDFLTKQGMEVADAVELLTDIVKMERTEAFGLLPGRISLQQKNDLLDMTHGSGSIPPAYVLVYNDLIEQNLAVSVMARWDFRKAKALGEQKRRRSQGVIGVLGKDAGLSYVNELLSISGPLLKYTGASPLTKREGNQLTFRNGARVDMMSHDAWVNISPEGRMGPPGSFFYVEGGNLIEKTYQTGFPEASLLFFEDGGVFYAVLADARLIRSLLFRLYYLRGQGLIFFAPLVEKGSFAGGTVVKVFEIDRQKFGPSKRTS